MFNRASATVGCGNTVSIIFWLRASCLACSLGVRTLACLFILGRDRSVAPSATGGAVRKKRIAKAGVPGMLVWYCWRSIGIELDRATASAVGRSERCERRCYELERTGGSARSGRAAMRALRKSC